jgi:galactokinase
VDLEACRTVFREHFGALPRAGARAPGRVNLIGEHTDYNQGRVLPCAIHLETCVVASPRSDGRVRVASRETGERREFQAARPERTGTWLDYVQAPFFALAEAGLAPSGADLAVASDVPTGSGLSSSAALGVATAAALDALWGWGLEPLDWARAAHRGENAFVGVGCGIMDPWASALGREGCALRIDCRSEEIRAVPVGDGVALLVAHSGVQRRLAAGAYGDRRAECEAAFAAAREAGVAPTGATALCDLREEHLPALEAALPAALFRRVRHVVRDDARVDALVDALVKGELGVAGALLRAGHASLRDDFEVSIPELDALCEIADALPGVHGSRLTGAGFGGCTVHLVDAASASGVAEALSAGFAARFGHRPPVLATRPSPGATRLDNL